MLDILLKNFYTTERRGAFLSDHGGPFGFDIHFALEVDYCINSYECDCIIETGTNSGDTTEYLAKQYPTKQIISCESNKDFYEYAKGRLQKYKNVLFLNESSQLVVEKYSKSYKRSFYYLDAHWEKYWPTADELRNIDCGVVCISDFSVHEYSIKYPGREKVTYGHDLNDKGEIIDSKLILNTIKPSTEIYINNCLNLENYEFPCHQSIRRSGRAYFCKNIDEDKFKDKNYFFLEKEFSKKWMR